MSTVKKTWCIMLWPGHYLVCTLLLCYRLLVHVGRPYLCLCVSSESSVNVEYWMITIKRLTFFVLLVRFALDENEIFFFHFWWLQQYFFSSLQLRILQMCFIYTWSEGSYMKAKEGGRQRGIVVVESLVNQYSGDEERRRSKNEEKKGANKRATKVSALH